MKLTSVIGLAVERKTKAPVQAINGRCLKCGYRLAWLTSEQDANVTKPTTFQSSLVLPVVN